MRKTGQSMLVTGIVLKMAQKITVRAKILVPVPP